MKNFKKLLVLIFVCTLFLISCTKENVVNTEQNIDKPTIVHEEILTPLKNSDVFNIPKSQLYDLLITKLAEDYPIYFVEPDTGFVGTQVFKVPLDESKDYVIIPSSKKELWQDIRCKIEAHVDKIDENTTRVEIRAFYEGLYIVNTVKQWEIIKSNGRVENNILTSIELEIKH